MGAGGLGSPAALYLAAAGVGTLGIVDPDAVDVTNLQRQILHGTAGLGAPKVDSARARLHDVNPHVAVETGAVRLTSANALEIVAAYDVVVDGSDNFPTRYLVNDACVLAGRPNVYGSVYRWEGQLSVFATEGGPCYRCLFREPPPPGLIPNCAEAGSLRRAARRDRRGPGDGDDQAAFGCGRGAGGTAPDLRRASPTGGGSWRFAGIPAARCAGTSPPRRS